MGRTERWDWVLAGLMAAAGLLLFFNLGGRVLWEDEAETVLLARSILKTGYPRAFDGLNVVSTEGPRAYDYSYLWRWSPWGQFYGAAASMRLFGESDAGARALFAFLGWLCVPALYFLGLELYGSRRIARLGAFFLCGSVPFLLHARQARWYAEAFLLVLAAALALARLRRSPRVWPAAAACGAALFYVNYLIALAWLAALLAAFPLLRPGAASVRRAAAAASAIAVLALPALVFHRASWSSGAGLDLGGSLSHAWFYATAASTFVFPLALWPLLDRRPATRYLLAALVLGAAVLSLAPFRMFRYLAPAIPLGCLLSAAAVDRLWDRRPAAALALSGALALTGVVHRAPFGWIGASGAKTAQGRWLPLASYLGELARPFPSATAAVAEHLRAHASAGDVVLATGEDLPLQRYTGLKVVGGFQGLPLPPDPRWVVIHPWILSREPGKDFDVARFIAARLDLEGRYEAVPLDAREYVLENDPDPARHLFREPGDGPRTVLWRRRS